MVQFWHSVLTYLPRNSECLAETKGMALQLTVLPSRFGEYYELRDAIGMMSSLICWGYCSRLLGYLTLNSPHHYLVRIAADIRCDGARAVIERHDSQSDSKTIRHLSIRSSFALR